MDLEKHKEEFERVVKKYKFFEKEMAEQLSKHLLKEGGVKLHEFAEHFKMDKMDAKIFLSFIEKGIKFKEDHIDKK
ncbi:MAG: hypothetical protein KC589_02515 [Nanoarchaeota archaeon]|nr:hypothetical protein [Nanoarchaeota archaeon]